MNRVQKLAGYQNPLYQSDLSGLNTISLFEEMVNWLGDEDALVNGDQILTYSELNRISNRIGREILAHSDNPGERVAALAGISPKMSPMGLGVMKARQILVGLSPAHPVQRLGDVIKDAGARVILCCDETLDLAAQLADKYRLTIVNADAIGETNSSNLGLPYNTEDVISLIYTSGSTGNPKAVIKDHWVSLHSLGVHADMGLDASLRYLCIYHFGYGNGVTGPFKAWLLGGTLHPFDLNTQGLAAFIDKLNQEEITMYHSPPSMFRNVVRMIKPGELPSIQYVHLGGEPVMARDFESFKEKFSPACKFFNNYGMSEMGSIARNLMDHRTVLDSEIVPMGLKTDRLEIQILDEERQPVRSTQVGEMVIQSRYISPGYWKDPKLTAARIQRVAGSEERIFKTGDLVYQRPDGQYVYAGRKDSMVKVRGSRVHTTEVEAALGRIEGVEEAVIRVSKSAAGDTRLIAYIQPKSGMLLASDTVRSALANRLPAFMIPGQIVLIDDFPRTSSGKIDRQGLPDPDRSRPQLSHPVVDAEMEMEEKLLSIWEQVLEIDGVGVTDDFFDLGGDSLMAVELFLEIEKISGRNLPISLLLEAGNIRQQAALLEAALERDPWQTLVTFNLHGGKPPLFCFAGKGGNPIRFRHLASILGTDQPVYFLQSRGLRGIEKPLSSVEAIAADFIEEIRRSGSAGPYQLVGSSFGGKVAYEVACQLTNAGEDVRFVMMLDTFGPGYPVYQRNRPDFLIKLDELGDYFAKHWHSLRTGSPADRRAYIRYYADLVPLYFQRWRQKRGLIREAKRRARAVPAAYRMVEAANVRASRDFRPAPFPGRVILLRASQQPPRIVPDPTLGWGEFEIGTLETQQVDGHHGNLLMPPQVSQVADILMRLLRDSAP